MRSGLVRSDLWAQFPLLDNHHAATQNGPRLLSDCATPVAEAAAIITTYEIHRALIASEQR